MAHVCLLQVRVEKDKVIIRANKQVIGKKKNVENLWKGLKGTTTLIWDLFQTFPGSSVTEKVKAHGSVFSSH